VCERSSGYQDKAIWDQLLLEAPSPDNITPCYSPLPVWGRWLIEFGSLVGKWPSPHEGFANTVVVTVPFRKFVSLFILTGLIERRLESCQATAEIDEHFKDLRENYVGKNVICFRADSSGWHRRKAKLMGIGHDENGEFIRLTMLDTGKRPDGTYLTHEAPPIRKANSLSVVPDNSSYLVKLNRRTKPLPVVEHSKFMGNLLGHTGDLLVRTRSEAIVLGAKNRNLDECRHPVFYANPQGKLTPGHLADLVRPSCLNTYQHSWRTAMVSGTAKGVPKHLLTPSSNPIVILDSHQACIKHLEGSAQYHRIVILSRSEGRFEECISKLTDCFRRSLKKDTPQLPSAPPPPSIEISSFTHSYSTD